MAVRTRHDRGPSGRVPPRVWPADEPGLPPIDGVVAALGGFVGIGDATPLEIELEVSAFLGALGAGAVGEADLDDHEHEHLINGVVEVCLHHLDEQPPRVVLDFCWVLDAFDLGYLHWPLHERLGLADLPMAPAWAVPVGRAEITGARLISYDSEAARELVLLARHPTATIDHVVAVSVEDDDGHGVASDLLVHADADDFFEIVDEDPDMSVTDADPAELAALIDAALDRTFAGDGVDVSDRFAARYSVLEHYLAKARAEANGVHSGGE
ncbi:MAG: hypothetical protein U5K30_04165 [Acidimicrobiales bacterium]|nr:hypothetical protein [Acidimicrobiales bacterium]